MDLIKQIQFKKLSVRFAAMLAMTSIPPPCAYAADLKIADMSASQMRQFFLPVTHLRFVSGPVSLEHALALVRFVESPAWGSGAQLSQNLFFLSRVSRLGFTPALAIPAALQAIYESDLASGGIANTERASRAVLKRTDYDNDDPYAAFNSVVHAERLRTLAAGADERLKDFKSWRLLADFFSSVAPSWRLPLFVGPVDNRLLQTPEFGIFLLQEGLRLGALHILPGDDLLRFKAAMISVRTALYRDRHDMYRMARFMKLQARAEALFARLDESVGEQVCRGYALVGN